MILTMEQVTRRREDAVKTIELLNNGYCYVPKSKTGVFEDMLDLLDTIESQATQIEQLQAQVERCKIALESFRKETYAMTLPDNRIRMIVDKRINEALQTIGKIE